MVESTEAEAEATQEVMMEERYTEVALKAMLVFEFINIC
jgi:hypothetical protein